MVIGAGFGGIAAAVAVRDDGDPVVLERGSDVGGVWRENSYPGAACDIPSHLYSFSFALEHRWSRRFAPQPDILRYLRRITDEFGLRPRLRLRTEVTEARYDDDRSVWRLTTATGDALEAEVLVAACGQLTRPTRPDVPGLASFRGPVLHSARWDPDVDLRGRRVAVVGTGASAVQIVPAVADDVAHLTVFQRSAAHLVPKPDRRYSALHHALFRRVPAWRRGASGAADGGVRTRGCGTGRARLRRGAPGVRSSCCGSRSRMQGCGHACARPMRSGAGGCSCRRTGTAPSGNRTSTS